MHHRIGPPYVCTFTMLSMTQPNVTELRSCVLQALASDLPPRGAHSRYWYKSTWLLVQKVQTLTPEEFSSTCGLHSCILRPSCPKHFPRLPPSTPSTTNITFAQVKSEDDKFSSSLVVVKLSSKLIQAATNFSLVGECPATDA